LSHYLSAARAVAARGRVLRPHHQTDAPMPELIQMLGRDRARMHVVDLDRIDRHVVHRTHHQHERNAAPLHFGDDGRIERCRREHEAVEISVDQRAEREQVSGVVHRVEHQA
jgi:hypothetical protein